MGLCDTKLDISEFLAGSHHLSQRAKRNGDFRCYQQAAYPVPPAAICRLGREGYSCCFQVNFLRFSQIQCNLLGTAHKDQEGINEQPGQPVWGISEGGVQLQELHRHWAGWMGACQEGKYWTCPVSTTSLRLNLSWLAGCSVLLLSFCMVVLGAVCCLGALQAVED